MLRDHLKLQVIVVLWGFTAVLGELISLSAPGVVTWRCGLAALFVLGNVVAVSYFPSWIEIMVTLGLIAAGFLVYGVVVRFFRLFPDTETAH